jgi:hypothetical protein
LEEEQIKKAMINLIMEKIPGGLYDIPRRRIGGHDHCQRQTVMGIH